jgi:hypothetical protein
MYSVLVYVIIYTFNISIVDTCFLTYRRWRERFLSEQSRDFTTPTLNR